MLAGALGESILGRAQARGLVDIRVHNLRDHATGRHLVTDEPPFGGRRRDDPQARAAGRRLELLRSPSGAGGPARPGRPALHPGGGAGAGAATAPGARVRALRGRGRAGARAAGRRGAVHRRLRADRRRAGRPGGGRRGDAAAARRAGRGRSAGPRLVRARAARAPAVHAPGGLRAAGACPRFCWSGDHARVERWRRVMSVWRTWQRRPDLLETADLVARGTEVGGRLQPGARALGLTSRRRSGRGHGSDPDRGSGAAQEGPGRLRPGRHRAGARSRSSRARRSGCRPSRAWSSGSGEAGRARPSPCGASPTA